MSQDKNLKIFQHDIKLFAKFVQTRISSTSKNKVLSKITHDVNNACATIYRKSGKMGNVDSIIEKIQFDTSFNKDIFITDLLSETGILIDSEIVIAVLQVNSDYRKDSNLFLETLMGYRPHTDIIRSLPRSYFWNPGYKAPIEDLFDFLAIEFYAGKRSTDAEDGAIGWLIEYLMQELSHKNKNISLKDFSNYLEYWSFDRLQECLKIWQEIVKPALISNSS